MILYFLINIRTFLSESSFIRWKRIYVPGMFVTKIVLLLIFLYTLKDMEKFHTWYMHPLWQGLSISELALFLKLLHVNRVLGLMDRIT